MITIQEVKDHLQNVGLKATHPRMIVLFELIKSSHHPTADQLFECIKDENPGIARGTVYRILDHLVEAGLANQVATKQGQKRYDANLDQHNHIYCTKTHEIQDYHSQELNQLINDFFQEKEIENFVIKDIKLQINGEKVNPDKKVIIV
ncbi:MAG: transcriptional repressor [Cyclobacteriaceae bacterium]